MNDKLEQVITELIAIKCYFMDQRRNVSFASKEENHLWEMQNSVQGAIELLKEQEPLPVKYVDKGDSYPPCIYHSVCRACGEIVNYPEKFCKACGRGIIWVPFRKEEADV